MIDAVRLTTRVFRSPSADGYGLTHDVSAKAILTPLVAPVAFAVRLADLDIK